MPLPWILFGNPENRRVGLFQEALASRGQPAARVVPWIDVLRDPSVLDRLPPEPAIVRVDSVGEDFDVEQELLLLGHGDAARAGVATVTPTEIANLVYDRGRILCPRQQHFGFLALLARLSALFEKRPAWRVLNPPEAIADLFDKRVTSRRYESLGIPVPPRLEGITSLEGLREAVEKAGCGSAFVKISCGSSASCLAVYTRRAKSEFLVTTIEQADTGWYNTLRLQNIRAPSRVREIVDFLLREGSQIEQEVPKAKLAGRFFDCRVLVIDGEPAFTVVRTNTHNITNLHLGGTRGELDALRAAAPAAVFESAMESCRTAGGAHPTLHVGVDVMFEEGFTGHRVIEGNAFGDLLPNLTRDGLSVYEWEIEAAMRRHSPTAG